MKVDKTKETFNSPIFSFLQQLGRAMRKGSGKEIEKVMDTTLRKIKNNKLIEYRDMVKEKL